MSHWKGKQNEKSMLITISSLCVIAVLNPIKFDSELASPPQCVS